MRVLDRVVKGLRDAPRDALIYLSSEKEELNKSYNFQRAFDTIGAILGPLVGFILLNYFLGLNYRLLFLIASLLGFLAILTFVFVEDKKDNYSKNKKFILNLKIFPSNLRLYLLSFFLFSLGYFSLSLVFLRIQTIDSSLKTLPLFYFIFNLFFVIFAFTIGKNISQEYLATAQGTLNSLYGFGQLFGGLIGGLIWTKLNFTYAFLYGGFLISIALIFLHLAFRK
ncbi:hypothetical protein HRbin34_00472 [bacterium HR34]|nr:hypothetical protein HRbin34_00472 [bacterium HR34]